MKAKIIKKGYFWHGEIFATWWDIVFGEQTGWKRVTPYCLSEKKAKKKLESWIDRNIPIEKEFNL